MIQQQHIKTDGLSIYDNLEIADYSFVAYEDPMCPRKRKTTYEGKITQLSRMHHKEKINTRASTRRTIIERIETSKSQRIAHIMSSDPSIMYRVHSMKRSELEYCIQFGSICSKFQRRKCISKSPRKANEPTRRRIMTSRWSKEQVDAYSQVVFASHTSIT